MSDKIVIRNSYSHRVSTVKKSNGHSILRIIAYIMARKLENNLTGNEHNFSHKSGVINTGFFMPHGIKTEMNEEQFYNHIENNSHASTNIIAYSSILALPPELSQEEQIKVVEKFCEDFTEQYGTCISYAIHEADNLKRKKARLEEIEKYNLPEDKEDLQLQIQNNHVHFVIPYCKIEALTEQDLKSKRKKKSHGDTFKIGSQVKDFNPIKYGSEIKKDKPDLMNIEQNFLQYMRQKPCDLFNSALEKNGRIERYTHKSYKDLGLEISATTHEGEMVRSRVEQGKKMDVHEYNRQQKAKQKTESDYLNFINVPLPKDLAYKILNGEKLAEKELLDSLKAQPKSELEQAQELLNQINNAHQLIDNKLADHEHEPLDLREKLDRLKESNNAPGATPQEPETLSQKLERLKQKQAEKPEPKAEPKDDNDNDYSPL
ncbi:MobA/MobL family protein [Acinetobacter sp. YH12057]|uniref:MobA/MobL family protein n=1 Tax=Acinetobacter sp. YH12057 TaxID=2601057 RepID=UPI0015D2DD24|nr:MobA/MobL family protein [Acinetobacter sp. YH12057]